MSRLIQSIINTTKIKDKLESIIVFLDKQKIDIDILNLQTRIFCFDKHQSDINNKLIIIDPAVVNNCLSFLPDIVICCNLFEYPNSKNLSSALRLPQVNIIREYLPIKKEMALDIARTQWIQDINLVKDAETANKLYITNYDIISSNLENQIIEKVNKWTSI